MSDTMNRVIKALLGLVLALAGLGIIGIVFPVIAITDGFNPVIFAGLFGVSVWCSFMWLIPLMSSPKGKKRISWDERDRAIHVRSVLAGYSAMWLYVVAVCMIFWGAIGPEGTITTNVLILIVFGGMGVFAIASTVAWLLLYGRGDQTNE